MVLIGYHGSCIMTKFRQSFSFFTTVIIQAVCGRITSIWARHRTMRGIARPAIGGEEQNLMINGEKRTRTPSSPTNKWLKCWPNLKLAGNL